MWSQGCLFAVVLCSWLSSSVSQQPGCTNPPGIVLTPDTNQTVPINTDISVIYRCNVNNGRRADWLFMGIAVSEGSEGQAFLRSEGIIISTGADISEVVMNVTRTGRQRLNNREINIACSALDTSDISLMTGCDYYIRTFDIPEIPPNYDFNPFPGNLSRLVLTWDAPDNTVFDSGDPVVTTYTVTVSGPVVNFVDTTTDTRYEFVDSLDQPCAMHTFQVTATNDAGIGPPDVINETIPISPDIRALNEELTVDRIIITSPTTATVELTFPRAVACSDNFPLSMYIAHIDGVSSTDFSLDNPGVDGREIITVSVTDIPANQNHLLSVSACITVTCRESVSVSFMTTDVQSARITFFETNVYLSCTFATNSQALGCVFIFTISQNITEELTVEQGQSEACNVVQNMESVYLDIQVFDWESDGGYGNVPVPLVRSREATEQEYLEATGCMPPTPEMVVGLPVGGIIGIVVAVVALLVIAIVVIIVIVIAAWHHNKRSKTVAAYNAKKEAEEADMDVVCEGECPPRSGSVEETDSVSDLDEPWQVPPGAAAPPPPPMPMKRMGSLPTRGLRFELRSGRKNGKMVISREMLQSLLDNMENNQEKTEYNFHVS